MRQILAGLILPAVLMFMSGPVLAADHDDPRVQLLEAIVKNDAGTVQDLLLKGVDPNVREAARGPAVVMAASEKSYGALQELAAVAATDLDAVNNNGETALMVVSRLGHLPSVSVLLSSGARVNREGWSPLHMAAGNGHVDVVQKLVKARANVDAKSDNGTTAMMLAARNGHVTAYQELIKAGADPTPVNDAKLGAVDYLEQHGESERARLLRQYIKTYKAAKIAANKR